MKNPLPVQVPLRNANQPLSRALGQCGVSFEQFAQIMRVGIDGEHHEIQRRAEIIAQQIVVVPGRNVDGPVVLEFHQHGIFRSGRIREVKADLSADYFRLSRGPEMDVEHEVHSGTGAPGHSVWLDHRRTAGFPGKKAAIGIKSVLGNRQVHSRKPCSRGRLAPPS